MRPFLVLFMGVATLCGLLIVAEVGKTTAQTPAAFEAQTPIMGEPTAKSLKEFRAAMLKVADEAARNGEIPKFAPLRLRTRFTLFPETLERAHQAAAEQILADGMAQSYGAIDWKNMLAFLKEFIPILMEILKLFAGNHVPSQFICDSGYLFANDLTLAA